MTRLNPLRMITVYADGEAYLILNKKYYDHLEWSYEKDADGFLLINAYEFAAWIKKNAAKISVTESVAA